MATLGEETSPSLWQQLSRRKPVTVMTEETDTGEGELARTIGLFQLSLFGIGATIGTGIFIVLAEAAPIAGPAVVWSFVFAGVVAGLTAICYAELASAVPISGSSYSYALSNAPEADGPINLPAIVLIVVTSLLLRGASESAKVNAAMVLIKIAVLVLFVAVGVTGWNSDNLSEFTPFGLSGITSAAGIIFFSFIGLDRSRLPARRSRTHAATCRWPSSSHWRW